MSSLQKEVSHRQMCSLLEVLDHTAHANTNNLKDDWVDFDCQNSDTWNMSAARKLDF
jgi:hypothetical protein